MIRHRHPVIEQLMTPGEVAAEAGVNPRTVSQWHRRGKLTAVRTIGRHRRFRRAEVLAYLAARKDRTPMLIAVPAAILIMFNIAAIHTVAVSVRPGAPSGRHRRQPCPCRQPHAVPVQSLVPLPPRPPRRRAEEAQLTVTIDGPAARARMDMLRADLAAVDYDTSYDANGWLPGDFAVTP